MSVFFQESDSWHFGHIAQIPHYAKITSSQCPKNGMIAFGIHHLHPQNDVTPPDKQHINWTIKITEPEKYT